MRRLKNILFAPEDASLLERGLHQAYLAVFLLAFAVADGLLALRLAAFSCAGLDGEALYASYFAHPLIAALNLLPAALLMALCYFLTRRAWAAQLLCALPIVGFALVNYFKIQLRGDQFLAADLRFVRSAGSIVGRYSPELSPAVIGAAVLTGLMLLFALLLLPNGVRGKKLRLGGVLVCAALSALLYTQVYVSEDVYLLTENDIANPWSDVETFLSRGFWYPFLHSVPDAFPAPPDKSYSEHAADALLARYQDADIPPEKKVNVMGVMLEAFSDLSDFPMLAELESVRAIYEPLHELEAQSVSGELITNIFAGGTVDTEWGFLTGYARHGAFRSDVDSYVRYFDAQGYDTVFSHPGYGWFYNRRNINGYLGFSESVFTEDGLGELVDPEVAPYSSDAELFDYLLAQLDKRTEADAPLFSFSVSYQNHGPYDDAAVPYGPVDPADTGWSDSGCGILNHYLVSVTDTISVLRRFTDELERRSEPVVLVLFGDHKPWLGNDKAVYRELGVDLDPDTLRGLRNTYATPYLIWANSAAKEALDADFTGDGGELSPCFLMPELFDRCAWKGPGSMQLAREMRALSPLVHEHDKFLVGGKYLSEDELPENILAFYRRYLCAEYRRETRGIQP